MGPPATPVPQTARIEWGQALPSAIIAALVSSLLMVIPLGAMGLGMLVAGALSVVLYRRRMPDAVITRGAGARLGAVSGMLGFAAFAIISGITALVGGGAQLHAALVQAVEQSAARTTDPQAQHFLEFFKTSQGLAVLLIVVLAVMFVGFLIFSSLGGMLSAVLLRRRERR